MHEVILGKEPLVYDLQEPFRWVIDIAIIKALENKVFCAKDFIRTENYNLKLRTCGAKKLTKEVENALNMRMPYQGMMRTFSYIIFLKTRELAHYLLGKKKALDFNIDLQLKREDNFELRKKILEFPYTKAKKIGMSKGTLWNLKQNAKSEKSFRVTKRVKERLEKFS
jgi:CRISPR-associated protein Cas1